MISEAQKRAKRKYDAANMTKAGCTMRRTKYEVFRAACEKLGTNPNAVFLAAVDETIKKAGADPE